MSPRTPPPPSLDEALAQRLRRLREALAGRRSSGRELAGELLSVVTHHALDHVSARLQQRLDRQRARAERRRLRALRRQQRALPTAAVRAALAVGLAACAVVLTWGGWLWIPAILLGISSYAAFASRRRSPGQDSSSPPTEVLPEAPELRAITERDQRVERVALELAGHFKSAPSAVRRFVQKPQDVVTGLRDASRELGKRERELRVHLLPEETSRLESERSVLLLKVANEPDALAKARLDAALGSLDSQLAHRRELAVRAARLEAEGVRIVYALENLRAQLLHARSAGQGADAGALLEQGLAQVSEELVAITDALESTR